MKNLMIASVFGMLAFTSVNSYATNGEGLTGGMTPKAVSVEQPFIIQEEIAQFPGGDAALNNYLIQHINYPTIAKAQGFVGNVVVSFVIDETGKVTDVEVVKAIGGGCEEEVVRVLTEMPNWKPTKQAGNNIKAKKLFSFNFQL